MFQEVKSEKEIFAQAVSCLSRRLSLVVSALTKEDIKKVFEIRVKVNQPLMARSNEGIKFISDKATLSDHIDNSTIIVSAQDITDSFSKICDYSVYRYQEDIKNGFITIQGGHRIGICGTAVKKDGLITCIKDISSINIRIAREAIGVSRNLLAQISENDLGLLIVGAPSSGKTTLLRDIARELSCTWRKCVTIVDERCELAATYNGVPHNNIGTCDVMDGYPKGQAILQAVRALSPEVIVCDEIGGTDDVLAVQESLNAGVAIIASIHADSLEALLARPQARRLIDTGAFKKIVLLEDSNHPAQVKKLIKVDDLYVKNIRNNNDTSLWHNARGHLVRRPFYESELS